ncbi:MAG: hypothetical protein Q4C52_04545 [Eubacteriales bacterium]|nr:hypothetical protein [Eubacteriales bacterium]
MAIIMDYLKWHGDLTFTEVPSNATEGHEPNHRACKSDIKELLC